MSLDPRLLDILERWDELRERGETPTLNALCRDAPELRDELARRIGALERAEAAFRDNGSVGTVIQDNPGPAADGGEAASVTLGARYGGLRFHARGGLGEVFVGTDEELGRRVALKRIQSGPGRHPESVGRFLREARITSQLDHPGVVPVFGVGVGPDGRPCYAMRFIEGQTLREALAELHRAAEGEKRVRFRQVLQRFVAVCQTVAYAHSRGVVHRDLKPDNVMLGPYGETLVVDWGLAKASAATQESAATHESPATPSPERTADGAVMGTPAYMAPEQAAGLTGDVGPAADVYSLGATLYHVLTGRPPFERADVGEVLRRVQRGDFPAPRRIAADVPPALEAVCLKAMARDPAGRYSSALDLAADVERWLADEPVSCRRDPASVRLARWARRHRTLVASAIVAVLLLTAGGVAGLFAWQRADTQAREFTLKQAEQRAQHRAEIEAAARADLKLALAEAQRGRFAGAEQVLYKAADNLRDEPELAGLRDRIESSRDRLARVAAFYRALDQAEYLAANTSDTQFSKADEQVSATCVQALAGLGVRPGAVAWWRQLPDDELRADQRQRLESDTVVMLALLALWHGKKGFLKDMQPYSFLARDPIIDKSYRAARAELALVQNYYETVHGRRSSVAHLYDLFCRWRMGEKLPPEPVRMDRLDANEAFFLGVTHIFVGDTKTVPLGDIILLLVPAEMRRLSGLDYDRPLETAERLLRRATTLDPGHYLAHFWLALCLRARGDHAGSEQAGNACVGLRPDYSLGYHWRGLNRVLQVNRADLNWSLGRALIPRPQAGGPLIEAALISGGPVQHAWKIDGERTRDETLLWGMRGVEEGLARLPDEPTLHYEKGLCLVYLRRPTEQIEALTIAAELEAARTRTDPAWADDPRGVVRALYRDAPFLLRTRPDEASRWALLALSALAAGKADEATAAAESALQRDASNGPARAVRGVLLMKAKRPADALIELNAVGAGRPGDTLATFGRAWALEELGESEAALREYDRLLVGTGSQRRAGTLAGWIQLRAHLGRARTLQALGRGEASRTALDDARAIDPTAAAALAKQLPD